MKPNSAAIAAVLSFIFPGLGHLYLRLRRQALVFAIPAIIVAGVLGLELLAGADSLLAGLIAPSGAMTVFVLLLLTGGWRIVAMVDAVLVVRRKSGIGPVSIAVTGVLVLLILASHGSAAYVAYTVYDAGSKIFVAAGPDDAETPNGGETPAGGSADGTAGASASPIETDEYLATPLATPATRQSRINILLTGVDSAATRAHSLTDTILVLSVDPVAKSVIMTSLPRDISNFPLYNGGTYAGKINSLMTYARNHKKDFPDGPFPSLMKEVGYLIGVPIHYYAAVDLQGFRKMVDVVGGVTVDNPKAINDPKYDWLDGTSGFFLDAGKVKLNGRLALAYVRSRQGIGDSDYTRARRQQQVLVALRDKLASPGMLPKLADIIRVAGDTVRTSLPADRLDEFIALARETKGEKIRQYVLGPPYANHPPSQTTGGVWTLKLDMDKIAELSVKLFGTDSRYSKP